MKLVQMESPCLRRRRLVSSNDGDLMKMGRTDRRSRDSLWSYRTGEGTGTWVHDVKVGSFACTLLETSWSDTNIASRRQSWVVSVYAGEGERAGSRSKGLTDDKGREVPSAETSHA
ncbi:uncharacterized protein ARMOST_08175 [Armillaria ostoyae]|uniref:Uncharacterized protein n=1 Tax=Armillaria ostoyae TaxID=47428 RepID=A0A284R7Y7_ARMOS|nr:uncharacterized protein ARMOST_08175 [Armillaria ostoyae]